MIMVIYIQLLFIIIFYACQGIPIMPGQVSNTELIWYGSERVIISQIRVIHIEFNIPGFIYKHTGYINYSILRVCTHKPVSPLRIISIPYSNISVTLLISFQASLCKYCKGMSFRLIKYSV